MNQLLKSREKVQLLWAIQLFQIFLVCIAKRGIILPTRYEEFKKELDKISQNASSEQFSEGLSTEFNALVSEVNTQMKKAVDPVKYAPFPLFGYATGENLQPNALHHLDMVQRTLNEAAKATIVDWGAESGHFFEILKVFTEVEAHSLMPKEAMEKLTKEIEKINANLPPEFHFPMPDVSVYES